MAVIRKLKKGKYAHDVQTRKTLSRRETEMILKRKFRKEPRCPSVGEWIMNYAHPECTHHPVICNIISDKKK